MDESLVQVAAEAGSIACLELIFRRCPELSPRMGAHVTIRRIINATIRYNHVPAFHWLVSRVDPSTDFLCLAGDVAASSPEMIAAVTSYRQHFVWPNKLHRYYRRTSNALSSNPSNLVAAVKTGFDCHESTLVSCLMRCPRDDRDAIQLIRSLLVAAPHIFSFTERLAAKLSERRPGLVRRLFACPGIVWSPAEIVAHHSK